MSNNKSKVYNMNKTEISISEILRIIILRKWIIIIAIFISLIVALLFNALKKPVYQSSVLVKKEVSLDPNLQQDRIENLLSIKSQDEIETEMQLVQTRTVINKVINKLSLNILVTKIVLQDGTVTNIDLPITEYQNRFNLKEYPDDFPSINRINIGLNTFNAEFQIKQNVDGTFKFTDQADENPLLRTKYYSELKPEEWEIDIVWPKNNIGEIHFESIDYNEIYEDISTSIYTDKKIKTNIFEIAARSNYSLTTKLIANTIAEKYQESRIALRKDNIKYSFNFVDERLKEVSENLKNSENELSLFKSKENIVQIDEQSKNMIGFLSNLESEKLKNDLDLRLYNDKIKGIEKEMFKGGFVDQTFLTPENYQQTDSPFSNLLNELSRLELRKLELLQKRTEIHPDVSLLTDQINRIKDELSTYNQNTITAYQILSNAIGEKQNKLDSMISKYLIKLEKLPRQEAKLASLIRQRDAYEKMYTLLLDKREEIRVAELSKMQDIIILDPATESIKPIYPNKKLNLLVAGLFGVFLGLFGVVFAQTSDKKINDISDIERDYNFPILSVVPPFTKKLEEVILTTDIVKKRFVTMAEDHFKYKEAYRTLETKLASKIKGKSKTVMITSCEENAGKTTAASNLALTIAQSGKKVVLIDCDIRKPKIAEQFGLPKFSSGLIDYLMEKTDSPNIYKPIKLTKKTNLLMNIDIIPTGVFSNISGEILASERMRKLLENLEYYDFVILDTPPITQLSDALALGRIVKDTVLVVRSGQTIKESINWAIGELQTTDINFLGLLVNDCEVKNSSYKYQYSYAN